MIMVKTIHFLGAICYLATNKNMIIISICDATSLISTPPKRNFVFLVNWFETHVPFAFAKGGIIFVILSYVPIIMD